MLTDDVDEIDETFKLTVFVDDGFVNITEGDPDVTTVLIKDDDGINYLIHYLSNLINFYNISPIFSHHGELQSPELHHQ